MGQEIAPQGLDDRQKRLIEAIIDGKSDQEAEAIAEYGRGGGLGAIAASPAMQADLRAKRMGQINGHLATKALKKIEKLIDDDRTPAATALAASKFILELAGHGKDADEGKTKPLAEMSEGELQDFIRKAEATVKAGGEPPVINVTPGNGA